MKTARPALYMLLLLALAAMPGAGQQADPAADFRQNCMSCHTVGGGRLSGPDLRGVTERKDREWLVRFIQDPKAVIDSGDAYAVQLLQDYRGVMMPTLPGMTAARARALLDLIEAESMLEKSQFMGVQISDRPFTPLDIETGRLLFLGSRPLSSGGPSCLSCHTVRAVGRLGGGRLGPDLTRVYERLEGRKGMSAWLSNPAGPVMASVYRAHPLQGEEILPLVAFFEDAAKKGGQDDAAPLLKFLLLGMAGMVVGLVSLDMIWKKRLRGVRREMVRKASKRGQS